MRMLIRVNTRNESMASYIRVDRQAKGCVLPGQRENGAARRVKLFNHQYFRVSTVAVARVGSFITIPTVGRRESDFTGGGFVSGASGYSDDGADIDCELGKSLM